MVELIHWPGLTRQVALAENGVVLLVDRGLEKLMIEGGLLQPWELVAPRPEGPGTGRGPRGTLQLADGAVYLVKQCLRGGFAARFNRDRYFAIDRFVRELNASSIAFEAGAPVAPTVAVVLRRDRPGWRVWSVSRLAEGHVDLARIYAGEDLEAEDARRLYEAAVCAIAALHRSGVLHRDMNLGNLVARRLDEGGWRVVVVDLDRAVHRDGGLSRSDWDTVLARLDRSWAKILGSDGVLSQRERSEIAARHAP